MPASVAPLLVTLEKCAKQFRYYEQLHTEAKKLDKAKTNREFAEECEMRIRDYHNR